MSAEVTSMLAALEEPSAEDFWKCPGVRGRQCDLSEMF